ncbi:DNA methylase [Pseudoxanthomonas broegbernensis]|uniref:DNA-3-methyladenine glycosylase II n=1 Tax=Pseudoxanthomonas broegbernensis TaxID=83619 RepID=A0A7V8GPD3_9GAMM|nr:AlkA N-terminal domain-containing protein [Pseudoxanthomonas broegbernensis]KAF1687683.1 DNA methylase [Pseudoxanthomonas broegbernensis]MBB6064710.1 AraC family transcriptional regulator of adaptative response / DNA-3-methyladenine glycosylase II [Pseudoxanthomonas broegbernensis]
MSLASANALPDHRACERARLSRDPRFDGLFFTAVRSTGIYCRPVCPAPAPKRENVDYYPSAAAAEAAGFRPCLRCRPELAPGQGTWRRGDEAVARALKLIDQGFLAAHPVADLAARMHLGERQLRRLFVERLGAAPIGVHGTRRLLFAKQLLTETALPVTEVALAAGFASLRRFNAAFLDAYRMAPRDLRRDAREDAPPAADRERPLTLKLGYRPPYDLAAMLDFLRGRALPGVEAVDAGSYARVVGTADAPGWLRVSAWPGGRDGPTHALKLELHGVPPVRLADTVHRVRRMFDLDADPDAISTALCADPRLRPLLRKRPGLRLPSGWDGFEIAVRAVIGQQVSVAAARTLAARLAQRHGHAVALAGPQGLSHLFPAPAALAEEGLEGLGLTAARAATVRRVAAALLDGRVDFRPDRTLDEFAAAWTALPGIGPWTAHYLALRALGHPDAFPAEDLVLQKALPGDGSRLSPQPLRSRAEAWRPWRAYAVIHLWRDAMASAASARNPR